MLSLPQLPHHLVFDWGNTLMADFPGQTGPMHTWPELRLMPAAEDVLPRLAAKHTLSIATNASDSGASAVRLALARVGIDSCFTHVFTAKDIGCGKQDPSFWPLVLKRLSTPAEGVTMIGDDLEVDVLPALRAGLGAVWYLPGDDDSVTRPHFLSIRTLRELLTQFR